MTLPVVVKRDPWHGQSQDDSAAFHPTTHPMCVQTADRRIAAPSAPRVAATFLPSRSMMRPSPRFSVRSGRLSTPAKLYLRVRTVTVGGKVYTIATSSAGRTLGGKGKRDAGFIGGGAAGGAVIGALAGGGKGAAIGAAAGAGAGWLSSR